jgi:glycerol-3-phosphate acyltransferase PlsY
MEEPVMPIILGQLFLVAIIGYLWGSVPTGYWMGKLLRGKDFDIRAYGSHKIGATNVLRTLGRWPAAVVFLFDLSKGLAPTLMAFLPFFYAQGWGPAVAGLAALLGHCLPVFIGFKGGRGVLTGSGVVLVLSPITFLIDVITTFSTIGITRYVSLGSIVGGLTTMICGIIWYFVGLNDPSFFARVNLPSLLYLLIGPALVILFHSDNIGRLFTGKERKIGQKDQLEEHPPSTTTTSSSSNVQV